MKKSFSIHGAAKSCWHTANKSFIKKRELMKTIEATNFIEQIINEDIENGKITAVQTRFPPEPNGYLHIGHVKSMLVNFGTAKKYDGKCNLFFDDTNPSKEKTEFVDAIRKDIAWVGYDWAKEVYASDFLT
jgi:glutaminyl-tRNA synthetase